MFWVPLLSRPGTCAGDGAAAEYKSSVQFPDEMLTFIKTYPLMDEAVPSVNERPCFTRTSSRYHRNTRKDPSPSSLTLGLVLTDPN